MHSFSEVARFAINSVKVIDVKRQSLQKPFASVRHFPKHFSSIQNKLLFKMITWVMQPMAVQLKERFGPLVAANFLFGGYYYRLSLWSNI